MPESSVVQVSQLSRRFGRTLALDEVSVQLQPGLVYGLVGANGAGKTTLIKHLLGLLRAQSGTVRVFDRDPVKHPVEVLRRIGYLSEERDLPDWMRVDELMRYTAAYHSGWDQHYAEQLLTQFDLDASKKIQSLSKGMRAQAGLVAAVAHRPGFLLLDEPSTGLDAVVRKDILNAIVRTIADAGSTVLFSSHLLDEVEQMSDRIIMIDSGHIVLSGDLDDLKERHHRLTVRLDARVDLPDLPGVLSAEQSGNSWLLVIEGEQDQTLALLQAAGGEVLHSRLATLHEIFLARVSRRQLLTMEG